MDINTDQYNNFMAFAWELNTLVNGTHEGRCLARHFSHSGEEFLQWIESASLEESQYAFLRNEISIALPRLLEEEALLKGILSHLEKILQLCSREVKQA